MVTFCREIMVFLGFFFLVMENTLSEAQSGTCLLEILLDFGFFKHLVEMVDVLCLCM